MTDRTQLMDPVHNELNIHLASLTRLAEHPSPEPSTAKQLSFPDSDLVVTITVDAFPGCGGVVWPAGEHLANHLAKRGHGSLAGKVVLELGSGTGLVGVVAAMLGGTVWITDQSPLLDIMQRNVDTNNVTDSVTVAELNWGEHLSGTFPQPDLIVAADCVYLERTFPLLVKTLSDLANRDTEILFCYQKRRKADKRFFLLLRKEFSWVEVDQSQSSVSLLKLSKKVP